MTEPVPLSPMDWQSLPTWCRLCEIHMATNHRPLCPSCLDDQAKEAKR